jgi:hypothetical protein
LSRHGPKATLDQLLPIVLLAAAIERLYDLRVGTTPVEEGTPHEKPHKPLLLLAAFDLIRP